MWFRAGRVAHFVSFWSTVGGGSGSESAEATEPQQKPPQWLRSVVRELTAALAAGSQVENGFSLTAQFARWLGM